jgi:hypothetical protein
MCNSRSPCYFPPQYFETEWTPCRGAVTLDTNETWNIYNKTFQKRRSCNDSLYTRTVNNRSMVLVAFLWPPFAACSFCYCQFLWHRTSRWRHPVNRTYSTVTVGNRQQGNLCVQCSHNQHTCAWSRHSDDSRQWQLCTPPLQHHPVKNSATCTVCSVCCCYDVPGCPRSRSHLWTPLQHTTPHHTT